MLVCDSLHQLFLLLPDLEVWIPVTSLTINATEPKRKFLEALQVMFSNYSKLRFVRHTCLRNEKHSLWKSFFNIESLFPWHIFFVEIYVKYKTMQSNYNSLPQQTELQQESLT